MISKRLKRLKYSMTVNTAITRNSWSHESRPNHMLLKESYRHWCQVDYGTSCLIRGLRKANGLISNTPLSYLSEGFERRSGLFFANPYLVDWVLALAIENDLQADTLGTQLLLEV